MCDWSLMRGVDSEGNAWVICQGCTKRCSVPELAIDPEDGLPWDICKKCKKKEEEWEKTGTS